ncbi:MAG: DUF4625 domain-containing protein [Treponema sp.]|nr:DUF4625 domain-containing protein [Treponema sp.]
MRRIHRAIAGKYTLLGLFVVLGLMVCLPPQLHAAGRKVNTQTAEGVDIWQKEFDVSGLRPGTYNVIINAKDAAGNTGVSGPFNIKVDPLAGLLETRVVYPDPGQVMRGTFNLVGVATARYGVKQILVKIDDGEFVPIEGGDYWSLNIPADSLPEGVHTAYVKGIDQKDLEGPVTRISFTLDVIPPAIELTNHVIGDLIAGNVTITGRIDDVNGIQSAALSADGVNFTPLSLRGRRGDSGRHFSFPIRTRAYADGAVVYYVRAVNKTGYAVTRPFLFFVDNEAPQIAILSPELKEDTYGRTQVTGRVIDTVGLTQFYYEWAGERVDIPLRPGDPFWAVTFPISMANNRAIPFRVTAVDKSGNITTVTQRFQDTRRFRTPTLVIDYPKPGGLGVITLAADQPIYGHILEGFFPAVVVMENQIESIDAVASFRIDPELIPVGRNNFRLWAQDEDDTLGLPITVRVNRAAPPSGDLPYSPITIDSPENYAWFGESVTVRGFIDDYSPGSGIQVEYRLGPEDSWKPVTINARGSFNPVISLADLPEGFVHLELRTVRGGTGDIPYYLPVNKFVTKPAITFLTPQPKYGSIHGNVTTSGMLDYYVPIDHLEYSVDGRTFERLAFTAKWGRAWFNYLCDYTDLANSRQQLVIRATDRAGNRIDASPEITYDNSADLPVPIVNAPLDGELVTGEFEISGLAFDDDGVAAVYWRILTPRNPWDPVETTLARRASTEYQKEETIQNFRIPLTLDEVADGENIVEVFAEDIYGVAGEKVTRIIRVSTAAPEVVVKAPAMDLWNRGNVMVDGTGFDLNGVESILVSMDNGTSYQRANFKNNQDGTVTWDTSVNTRAYQDGVQSMLVRAVDKYGISSFSSGIVNIDNTPPDISLGAPNNGDSVGMLLPVTGQTYDNINLKRLSIQLVNIHDPHRQVSYDLPAEFVLMEQMDVSAFPDGDYNLKISAFDQAGNETAITRDVSISKARAASEVALINPMPGIDHSGPVMVSGRVTGAVIPPAVSLQLNHQPHASVEVDRYGVFRYELPPERVTADETLVFTASFNTPTGDRISSYDNEVKVSLYGPVVTIDSHRDGDVITKRPYLSGKAYISRPDEENLTRQEAEQYAVKHVQISYDNGRTFKNTKGLDEWKYRLETGELPPGPLPIVIKAIFNDGRIAVRRIILTVDTFAPVVTTIGPVENSSYRDSIPVYGAVTDNFDMDTVEVTLRPGDKAGYSVPGFIQGLYLDTSVLGGLSWSAGLGLTFFEDNVKWQFQAGNAPSGRYSGWVFGTKILGNIFKRNLGTVFGPDWDFWTTAVTLGGNFSYFLMEEGEKPLFMGAFLLQWEIIKADMSYFFPDWKYFKSLSFYVEPAIWFAPSDVSSQEAWRTKLLIAFGGRISLF